MLSIKNIYRIGPGPSSSHTMGPKKAIEYILEKYQNSSDFIRMSFLGSLAQTGKGHLSDYIAEKTFNNFPHEIIFNTIEKCKHPNTMIFEIYKNNILIKKEMIISIGGGLIKVANQKNEKYKDCYLEKNFQEIKNYCIINHLSLIDYIYAHEEKDINLYMNNIMEVMLHSVENGLKKEGLLPGKLKVQRKAKEIYLNYNKDENEAEKEKRLICAYAFATSEENASGEEVVTSPTCGSCGIIPSLVRYFYIDKKVEKQKIIEGLLIAGLIGVIIQQNASISGAECGCQAEIGSASSMGAAFVSYIDGLDILGIERSSEIALEHSLGLTCDPIDGYVQIPCIERNAIGALRSLISSNLSKLMGTSNSKINFDTVVETMYQTGRDLNKRYRETAKGGLAFVYHGE